MNVSDIFAERLTASWAELGIVVLSTLAIFAAVILATRITGLRSLSKMSAFDFAMTVAVGSLIATVAVTRTSVPVGLAGLATLYAIQYGVALGRKRLRLSRIIDNQPTLLMFDGKVIEEALTAVHMTHDDLRAKLREANALRLDDVRAVVMETTGDVTVLHGDGPVDAALLRNVVGAEQHTGR